MKLKHLIIALTSALTFGNAHANIIDFNELTNNEDWVAINSYTTNGFLLSNSVNEKSALGAWGKNSPLQADPGHAAIFVYENWGNSITTLSSVTKAPFNFLSIDLADFYNDGASTRVEFSFLDLANKTSTQTVTLDTLRGLQTFTFNRNNLQGVSWRTESAGYGWHQFDNINVAPVPEPETYALMGMGLVGLLVARRRKSTKQ